MDQIVQLPAVAVIILNWNGKKYLERFIPVLLQSTYPDFKIYVADNGSTDDSVSFLRQTHAEVIILAEPTNEGFAGGYNRAIKQIPEEFIVLLNSDIEVTRNWLEPAVNMMLQDPHIGAVQPKILDFNNKKRFEYAGAAGGWIDRLGYPFSMGRIFDILENDDQQFDKPTPIFWASGAAMFTRKSIFIKLGGFDSYFFAHQEEIDLCWRMPLDEAYAEGLKTNFADIANVAGRAAGAVTAAKFLQRFAAKFPWAHLDIAGTAWKSGAAKGSTGRPVALLVEYLLSQTEPSVTKASKPKSVKTRSPAARA
jgi:glycosyltransferase involved in cell wall biosynthesis